LSHACGENFSCCISLRLESQQVANSRAELLPSREYFLALLSGKNVSTSFSWAKDKAWGDLLVALFGLVVSLVCHFGFFNSFLFSFCFLVAFAFTQKTKKIVVEFVFACKYE
jgi:hypothetical protein